jgi:putative hydrolase of the HAD superfamily
VDCAENISSIKHKKILQKRITTILFDMDNTLFDLVGAKKKACHAISSYLGRNDGEYLYTYFTRGIHGYEHPANIRDYMNDACCYTESGFDECCRIYHEIKLSCIRSYPGVHETLALLAGKGYKIAVVTDAHDHDAFGRLEKTGLRGLFQSIVTSDTTGRKKPDPTPFQYAMHSLSATPDETLIIGDSIRRDIAPGNSLGVLTAYARYGDANADRYVDTPAHFILDDIRDLLDILSVEAGEQSH